MKVCILHSDWPATRIDWCLKTLRSLVGEGILLRNQRKILVRDRLVEVSFINKYRCAEWLGRALTEFDVLLTMDDFLGYNRDYFIDLRSYFAHGGKLPVYDCIAKEDDLLKYVSYIVKGAIAWQESS